MEQLLYNPDAMSEADIRATFVGREALLDELLDLIEHQPDGAGVQHVVLIAPRGMGKTTLLLMLKFALNDRGLQNRWQAVKFPEESYGIIDLADFFIEVVRLLASETGDMALARRVDELAGEHPDSEELQEVALALLKDWRRQHGKRLLLLVENIDLMLEQIGDERANARLRDVLMNDGTLMLIGAATTFFLEARAYDQPLYNFFKLYNLADLDFNQMQELLRKRADLDGVADFEQVLRSSRSRLRALEYFTGGNPRLVLILYRVVTQSDITEVRRGLEKLLDEVTPYYKAKIESLPPQQRKILDQIARITGTTSEAVTPGEIARQVRLPPNQVSAQLKRLSELGYVRAADLRGRHTYYTLSEPLYAIWHQMRMGRDARRRMGWLVDFLRIWFSVEEIGAESVQLAERFRSYLAANRPAQARDVLEQHRYLAAAMDDDLQRNKALNDIIRGYLELRDTDAVTQELLNEVKLETLPEQTLLRLKQDGCISDEQLAVALETQKENQLSPEDIAYAEYLTAASEAYREGNYQSALEYLNRSLEVRPDQYEAWNNRGIALAHLDHFEDALACFDRALEIRSDDGAAWCNRGKALAKLGRFEDALDNYTTALKTLEPLVQTLGERCPPEFFNDLALIYSNRGDIHQMQGDLTAAIADYTTALKTLEPLVQTLGERCPPEFLNDLAGFYTNRGVIRQVQGALDEAITDYNTAINWRMQLVEAFGESYPPQFRNGLARAYSNRGVALANVGCFEDALASYDRALEIKPDDDTVWSNRGIALACLERFEDALVSYDRALGLIIQNNDEANFNRGLIWLKKSSIFANQDNIDAAKNAWLQAWQLVSNAHAKVMRDSAIDGLIQIAIKGQPAIARQLITEADLEEILLPFTRALDYLQTGNARLIEKLSPEVRGIARDIIAKLEQHRKTPQPPAGKTRSARARAPRLGKRL